MKPKEIKQYTNVFTIINRVYSNSLARTVFTIVVSLFVGAIVMAYGLQPQVSTLTFRVAALEEHMTQLEKTTAADIKDIKNDIGTINRSLATLAGYLDGLGNKTIDLGKK
jgi:hypothetical protein